MWRKNDGITLIEIITSMAIFSVVSAAVLSLFVVSLNIHTEASKQANYQDSVTLIVDKIRTEVSNTDTLRFFEPRIDDLTYMRASGNNLQFSNGAGSFSSGNFNSLLPSNYRLNLDFTLRDEKHLTVNIEIKDNHSVTVYKETVKLFLANIQDGSLIHANTSDHMIGYRKF